MQRIATTAMHKLTLTLLVLLGSALALAPAAQAAPPTLAFDRTQIVITGLHPGARVAVMSVARIPKQYHYAVTRTDYVGDDADRDSRVTIALPEGAPGWSVWCAVDLTTGEFVVAAPGGVLLRPIPATELLFPDKGGLSHLDINRTRAEVLVVRPGKGAWRGSLHDGASDGDGATNSYARATFNRLAQMKNVPAEGPLDDVRPGDVIVAVDPLVLHVFAGRVGSEVRP